MRPSYQEHEKNCEWCQQPFIARRSDARFCTSSCRSYAYRCGANVVSPVKEAHLDVLPVNEEPVDYQSLITLHVEQKQTGPHGQYPKPWHVEAATLRRLIRYDSPHQYGPPGEYVSVPYSILYFEDETTLQFYLTVYREEFEDDSALQVKGRKLFLPTADFQHLQDDAMQRYFFQSNVPSEQ